jgi:hypothetical protein
MGNLEGEVPCEIFIVLDNGRLKGKTLFQLYASLLRLYKFCLLDVLHCISTSWLEPLNAVPLSLLSWMYLPCGAGGTLGKSLTEPWAILKDRVPDGFTELQRPGLPRPKCCFQISSAGLQN